MGKLMHNTQIKHSSHHHLLQLSSNIHPQNQASNCNGCNLQISQNDYIYTCIPCNFYLHPSCSKFPELITHPSHREHTLSLLSNPIYPGGFFRCDACSQQGTRFSYHCQFCDFDLHVLCASKPLSVNHPFHSHPLVLTFSSPYGDKRGFSCDVCRSIGSSDQWLYRCVSCEFDVHLHCATAKMPPLQHHNSFPGAGPANQSNQFMVQMAGQPLLHSASTGHVQTSWQPPPPAQPPPQNPAPGGFQSYQYSSQPQAPPPPQPVAIGVQSYQAPSQEPPPPPPPMGVQSYQMPQQPSGPAVGNQNVGPGNGLGDVIVTGFVDGMMQQLGQNFIQSLTGGGGDGGGGGGGDGCNVEFQISTTNEDYGN